MVMRRRSMLALAAVAGTSLVAPPRFLAQSDVGTATSERIRDWACAYSDEFHPYLPGGTYINMMMEEGDEWVRAANRDNYPRLAAIRANYDPTNLFRVNQNVTPA